MSSPLNPPVRVVAPSAQSAHWHALWPPPGSTTGSRILRISSDQVRDAGEDDMAELEKWDEEARSRFSRSLDPDTLKLLTNQLLTGVGQV